MISKHFDEWKHRSNIYKNYAAAKHLVTCKRRELAQCKIDIENFRRQYKLFQNGLRVPETEIVTYQRECLRLRLHNTRQDLRHMNMLCEAYKDTYMRMIAEASAEGRKNIKKQPTAEETLSKIARHIRKNGKSEFVLDDIQRMIENFKEIKR